MFGNRSENAEGGMSATGARKTPFSLLGGDVVFTGNIVAGTDLHVDGRVDGDVTCATLVQGSDGAIHGNVKARTARIAGLIEGSVTADDLILEPTARIVGDCTYAKLTVATGATVNGRCESTGASPPELKVVAARD